MLLTPSFWRLQMVFQNLLASPVWLSAGGEVTLLLREEELPIHSAGVNFKQFTVQLAFPDGE